MNSILHDMKARSSSLQQAMKDLAVAWQFFENDNNKRFCCFRHVNQKDISELKMILRMSNH